MCICISSSCFMFYWPFVSCCQMFQVVFADVSSCFREILSMILRWCCGCVLCCFRGPFFPLCVRECVVCVGVVSNTFPNGIYLALQLLILNFCTNSSTRRCSQDLPYPSNASRRAIRRLTSRGIWTASRCHKATGTYEQTFPFFKTWSSDEMFLLRHVTQRCVCLSVCPSSHYSWNCTPLGVSLSW